MYNTTEKVTAVMGFVNIIFCLYTLIEGICGLTVQGFWKMSYSGLFLSVIMTTIIAPLVWVIITIVIQVIFLKGKKTPALFCVLLLIPHILGLLVKANAIIASPQDYKIIICIYGLLILGLFLGVGFKTGRKIYLEILVTSYILFAFLEIYRMIHIANQYFSSTMSFSSGILIVIDYYIRPVVLLISIALYGYCFLLSQAKLFRKID